MRTRPYKNTGETVSLLGFGAMRLPTKGEPPEIDYEKSKALIDEACAAGVNYFDTAYRYHGGASEPFLGRALAEYPRESYFLATKLPLILVKTRHQAIEIFEEQLKNCNTPYFDYYLMHSVTEGNAHLLDDLDLYSLFDVYKKQGKIRRLGFSFHGEAALLRQMLDKWNWDFAQIMYNYIDAERSGAQEQYDILEECGVPCIVMEPLRGGRLADLGPEGNEILKQAAPKVTVASWGMRWLAPKSNILTILSGMNDPAQLRDNIATLNESRPLSPAEEEALHRAVESFKSHALIPCSACRYCMPCPAGVDIPAVLALKNEHAFSQGYFNFMMDYVDFPAENKAHHCTNCGACEEACPQHLPIREILADINANAAQS